MSSHAHARTICTGSTVSGAFSALHLLRSYSLFAPTSDFCRYEPCNSRDYTFGNPDGLVNTNAPDTMIGRTSPPIPPSSVSAAFSLSGSLLQPSFLATVPPLMQSISVPQPFSNSNTGNVVTRHLLNASGITNLHRRPRSEKKAIPDNQKDDKYYERRKRNNQAAKKSRDARKIREDHVSKDSRSVADLRKKAQVANVLRGPFLRENEEIALRATMLEHENAILRAQLMTLREETQSLRHMLIKQQTPALQSMERSISSITPVTLSPPTLCSTFGLPDLKRNISEEL